jgi:hypothetical protein
MRISLRQLMVLVAVITFAIVSLKYASLFWQGFIGLIAMLAVCAAGIAAIFERGPRQVFAMGFVLVVSVYALFIVAGLKHQLPTSLLLERLYPVVSETGWFNTATNQRETEASAARLMASNPPSIGPLGIAIPSPVQAETFPIRIYYYATGHYWWALLLSYLGGKFARFVYMQRTNEQTQQSTRVKE